jgi:hypothetical protein
MMSDRQPQPTLTDAERLRYENERLKEAIRRLAEQDATLSLLCRRDGSRVVTVTMDATFTDEERAVLWTVAEAYAEDDGDPECERISRVLGGLLARDAWQRRR